MAGAQDAEPPLTAHFRIRRAPDREPIVAPAMALFLLVLGILIGAGGALLVLLGGSSYYLLGGIAVGTSGMLLRWERRDGLRLYAGFLLATLLWSLWEVGLDGWALAPRLVGPALVGLVLGLPSIGRALPDDGRRPFPPLAPVRAALLLLAVTLIAALLETGPPAVSGHVAIDRSALAAMPGIPGEWPAFGRDAGGDRFTPIAQITPANVAGLKPAWTYHAGIASGFVGSPVETTPIMVGDSLYLCTPANVVIALDPDSGREKWRYDPHVDPGVAAPPTTCRGVAYYRADAAADCPERIIATTNDARLLALDARTGRPCRSFGQGGAVDLLAGLGKVGKGSYAVRSAPTIIDDRIVLGARIADGQSLDMPSGVVRAFDAVTGRLAWAWDMGRPDDHGAPPTGQTFTRSTPNAWAPMSADDLLGLIYVPTGNSAVDHWGGGRSRAAERFGGALVALDAASGVPRWSFQTTHHDLWDYDAGSQPTLIDMPTPAGPVPAVVQPTKRGELFVLDRRTGAPLATVRERPVPQRGAVSGEKLAATQPFSIGMAEFAGPPLTEARMWGLTPLDQLWCRIAFRKLRYDGALTPPGTDRALIYPGVAGGIGWGGVSIDPVRGLMFVNALSYATTVQLVPRAADRAIAAAAGKPRQSSPPAPQAGSPYGVRLAGFESPLGVPCTQPPYARLAAVDLATRRLLWSRTIGSARDSGPFRLASHLPLGMGVPQFGGTLATASGLLFIGATQDRSFRAIDSASGRILWTSRLPGHGQANPMSYVSPRSGRQYVVIAAGGRGIGRTPSDGIVAYALPSGRR